VIIQERIPGVGLNVTWPYLSKSQKESFKSQTQAIIEDFKIISPPTGLMTPSYVYPDPDPLTHKAVEDMEHAILFTDPSEEYSLQFAHNDLDRSNIIVNNDRIVGLIDWELAGFFTRQSVSPVHQKIRSPPLERFAHLDITAEALDDLMFWNNSYEV
jgi:hypothetical protein